MFREWFSQWSSGERATSVSGDIVAWAATRRRQRQLPPRIPLLINRFHSQYIPPVPAHIVEVFFQRLPEPILKIFLINIRRQSPHLLVFDPRFSPHVNTRGHSAEQRIDQSLHDCFTRFGESHLTSLLQSTLHTLDYSTGYQMLQNLRRMMRLHIRNQFVP